jgi:hypothetical protein
MPDGNVVVGSVNDGDQVVGLNIVPNTDSHNTDFGSKPENNLYYKDNALNAPGNSKTSTAAPDGPSPGDGPSPSDSDGIILS